ncbi:RRM domain-containing protein [Cryptosporidium ubiquitum]|uniref:RRM domain-containing protein n=1 Tax=Cryptosporidium ubiquitum TaxID=857276 RepID=A0A1J4MM89_9CRYT|nr:RRM domain-containing protein [Cryptosporidium ubiquitum]OII75386.1 RRM domain-containing protein [Cryptosporidium ubiquitum]
MNSEQIIESETSDESCMSSVDELETSNINNEDLSANTETFQLGIGGMEVPHEKEDFRRVLTPLSKDQLVELLAGACIENQEILRRVFEVICESRSHRRLYIKNLPFSANTESVIEVFSQFGDVEEGIVLKKDGKSRGYAFVTFKTIESALLACKSPVNMSGRFLMVKLAADPFPFETKRSDAIRRKLFVRNLGFETNEESLSAVMGQYGELEESVILRTKSGESKGYGFVTFASTEATIKALQQPHHLIDGRLVFVHQAIEGKTRIVKNRENYSLNGSKQTNYENKSVESKDLLPNSFNLGQVLSSSLPSSSSSSTSSLSSTFDFRYINGELSKDSSFVHLMEKPSSINDFNMKYTGANRVLFDNEYLNPANDVDSNLSNFSDLMNDCNLIESSSANQGNNNINMRFYKVKDHQNLKLDHSNGFNIPAKSNNLTRFEIPGNTNFNTRNRISIDARSTKAVHLLNNDDPSERNYSISVDGNVFSNNINNNLNNNNEIWHLPKNIKPNSFLNMHVKAPTYKNLPVDLSFSTHWGTSNDFKTKMKSNMGEINIPSTEYNEFGEGSAYNFYYKESQRFPIGKAASWNNFVDRFSHNFDSDNFLKNKNINGKCDSKQIASPSLILDKRFAAF